jgi:hypothetical protein
MATSFPMEVEALDVPFAVVPNAAFPDATPVCVLTNNGGAPAFDTFIKSYFLARSLPPGLRKVRTHGKLNFVGRRRGQRLPGPGISTLGLRASQRGRMSTCRGSHT